MIASITRVFLSLGMIVSLGHLTHAEAVPSPEQVRAQIVDYGMIVPSDNHTSMASEDSHNGALFVMDPLEVPTFRPSADKQVIHAEIGVQFGILVQVEGFPDGDVVPVRTRWTHPQFKDAGVTVETWDSPMNSGYGRFAGWILEEPQELVPGDWSVEIVYGEKVIARQVFHVVLPR